MSKEMFKKVLIANRGEIARRIMRTLREMGIKSVAVYSDSDANAPHVKDADEAVRIGADPATNSYLDIERVLAAVKQTGADAVHPGYGFLAESLEFARALDAVGVTLLGPGEKALEIMGDKAHSRDHVAAHDVPVVPGFNATGMSDEEIVAASESVGFPLLIKPSAGGGGKGMEVVENLAQFPAALASAKRIAISAFGDDSLVIERLIATPRHIEVQVFGDATGAVYALGERECTLQRRHQKVIEEAPSIAITEETRQRLFEAAVNAAKSVDYIGAGTVEFLIDANNPEEFFFIEMNTRLQVEHPVTEAVTGLDLVRMQLEVAAGHPLKDIPSTPNGYAVEVRIYAESPVSDFMPSIGKIHALKFGSGVRVDSAVTVGSEVSPFYDPMIAKMIAHAPTREQALQKLDAALSQTVILGVETNIGFLRSLLNNSDVQEGAMDTGLIGRLLPYTEGPVSDAMLKTAANVVTKNAATTLWGSLTGWRIGLNREATQVLLRDDSGEIYTVKQTANENVARETSVDMPTATDIDTDIDIDTDTAATAVFDAPNVWVSESGYVKHFEVVSRREKTLSELSSAGDEEADNPNCLAPMPGAVTTINVTDGDTVEKGQVILAIEAMKMEHPVTAGTSGTVTLQTKIGEQVQKGALVATIS